jgi:hypothetical protein
MTRTAEIHHGMNELHASLLWLAVRRGVSEGRPCRDYECTTADGASIFRARAYDWRREIVAVRPNDPLERVLVLRVRRSFPLTGKTDIVGPDGSRLGVVHRNGRFSDEAGTDGWFRDVRTLRGKATESVLSALTALALGGEAETGGPPGFVCLVGSRPAGTLVRARAPWLEPQKARGEGRLRSLLTTSLARFRSAACAESTWKLELTNGESVDRRMVVAAALYMLESSRR